MRYAPHAWDGAPRGKTGSTKEAAARPFADRRTRYRQAPTCSLDDRSGNEAVGKSKVAATPIGIEDMLRRAERARTKAQLDRTIVAFEPTSHFWMLIAHDLERRGVDYLVVHPISVWRGREIREYNYAKDDFRDASLIAELAAQLHFTQARLRDPLWQTMRSLAYERFRLVELRSRALQETGAHLEVVFPNYPVFHRLSLASKAVLSRDPDPQRIAGLEFDDFVAETRRSYEGSRLSRSTLLRIHQSRHDHNCSHWPTRKRP